MVSCDFLICSFTSNSPVSWTLYRTWQVIFLGSIWLSESYECWLYFSVKNNWIKLFFSVSFNHVVLPDIPIIISLLTIILLVQVWGLYLAKFGLYYLVNFSTYFLQVSKWYTYQSMCILSDTHTKVLYKTFEYLWAVIPKGEIIICLVWKMKFYFYRVLLS